MAKWCLTKQAEEKLLEALKNDGDPQKMIDRGSDGRIKFFTEHIGEENAKNLNYLFESKMLLKNQQKAFTGFLRNVGGSKEIKLDFLSKVKRLETALSKKEFEQYLETYVSQRLKIDVTEAEFKNISDLTSKIEETAKDFNQKNLEWSNKESQAIHGATQRALENYISSLKEGRSIVDMVRDRGYQFKTEAKVNPIKASAKLLLDVAKQIAENSISLVATIDDSFIGRQGIFALLTGHPKLWAKTFLLSLRDIGKTLLGGKADDALMASIYSDPLYMNGEYTKAKIINQIEEQFPTTIPERLPIVGRFVRAADVAFTNSGIRMRTEMYTMLRKIKTDAAIEMTNEEIKSTAKVINSLFARGDLGRTGSNSVVRLLVWAPKMLKADFDILTAHTFDDLSPKDRAFVTGNLIKIIVATVVIEGIAYINNPNSTEFDPRSTDFTAIKFGDTRIKFLRGLPSMITLMARLLPHALGGGQYKSTTTGILKDYGPKIGQMTRLDAVINFILGKAPPATSALASILKGQDYNGNPPTFSSVILQVGVPISMQNVIKLAQNPTNDGVFGVIADYFGLTYNTIRETNSQTNIIPQNKKISNQDFMTMVSVYAKAMHTDPETAFNRIFTGQKIIKVSGNAVIVQRMSLADSQAAKKKQNGANPRMKLDHTVPLELGGSNDPSNLKLVTTSTWASYTKVENALGKALKEDKITAQEAEKVITDFKKINDSGHRKIAGQKIINKYK